MRVKSLFLLPVVAEAFLVPPIKRGVPPHSGLRPRSTTVDPSAPEPTPAEQPLTSTPAPAAKDGTRAEWKSSLLEVLGARSAADPVLACPVSVRPLSTRTKLAGPFWVIESKVCEEFGTEYPFNGVYTDLVPNDERKSRPFWELSAREVGTQELFRSPLTSFLYERGWRQNFRNAGFPGIDKEFEELNEFTKGVQGGVIVDMSCGSGLMTRRLVRSRAWQRVLACDYSESMLRETRLRFLTSGLEPPELLRADAARLPFQTDALDAMHAGAALHCWPRLEESLREVYRTLRPGGKFFATTFEIGAFGGAARNNSFRFFTVDELRLLLVEAGFPAEQVEVRREGRACLIAKATK